MDMAFRNLVNSLVSYKVGQGNLVSWLGIQGGSQFERGSTGVSMVHYDACLDPGQARGGALSILRR